MGNLEKPLTWGLTILLLGYLFVANCKCGEESTCSLNNAFNFSNTEINTDVLKVDLPETIEEDAVVESVEEETKAEETTEETDVAEEVATEE